MEALISDVCVCVLCLQGFDMEALISDVQELKSTIKQQELRIRQLEAAVAEKEAASSSPDDDTPAHEHRDDDDHDDD